jgi:hypothetical protein
VSHSASALPPKEGFWYSFLFDAESILGYSAAGRIRPIEKKIIDLMGNQTRDLPAYNNFNCFSFFLIYYAFAPREI